MPDPNTPAGLQPPQPDPILNTATQAIQQNPNGVRGFFAKLGQGIHDAAPQIEELGARLAQAGGNPGPAMMLQQKRQLAMQQQQFDAQNQSRQIEDQLHRLQLAQSDPTTPEYAAAQSGALKRQQGLTDIQESAKTPAYTPMLDENGNSVYGTNPYSTETHSHTGLTPVKQNVQVPNPALINNLPPPPSAIPPGVTPPTMPATVSQQQNIPAPQKVVHWEKGTDADGNPIVETYSQFGKPTGTQPAPTPANAKPPGLGGMPADIAGQIGPVPNPAQFKGGINSPEYQAALQKWSSAVNQLKQSQALALAGARGAALNATRPLQMYDPASGTDVYGTLGGGIKTNPKTNQPYMTGSQSGALNIAKPSATVSELDTNLAQTRAAIGALDTASPAQKSVMAATLDPSNFTAGQMAQGQAMKLLTPDQRTVINTIRNLRQGAASLKNILSSSGISDHRMMVLESELPNVQDLQLGDSKAIGEKLQTFENVYNEIKNAYPNLVTQPRHGNAAPPTRPAIPSAPTAGGGFANWQKTRSQGQQP